MPTKEETRQNMRPFKYKTQEFLHYGKCHQEIKLPLLKGNLTYCSKRKHFSRLNMFRGV